MSGRKSFDPTTYLWIVSTQLDKTSIHYNPDDDDDDDDDDDKVKGHPKTGQEDPEGKLRYSSTLSLTSALDGVSDQPHAPAALPPGKRPDTHCISVR